jgi:hypothetical protein
MRRNYYRSDELDRSNDGVIRAFLLPRHRLALESVAPQRNNRAILGKGDLYTAKSDSERIHQRYAVTFSRVNPLLR